MVTGAPIQGLASFHDHRFQLPGIFFQGQLQRQHFIIVDGNLFFLYVEPDQKNFQYIVTGLLHD